MILEPQRAEYFFYHYYVDQVVSTTDFAEVEINIYPNPTSSVLNVSLLGLEAQTFQVKNVLGQIVLKGNNMKTIDVSKLNGGVYILQLHIGEKIKVKRFIKN